MQSNKLLNNHNQNQPRVQNNLLQNNKLLMNNGQANGLQNMQAQQMYQIKQSQSSADRDKIKEIIIKPIKLEKVNTALFNKTLKEKEDEYKPKLTEWWEKKTNVPYKGILKNENNNLKIKDGNDLIIHRVTNKDKDFQEIENKIDEINKQIKTHDGELKIIYSSTKESEHKKKFNYTHVYQYRKPCLNEEDEEGVNDFDKIKKDRINYYKEQQKQQEKQKVKLDSVLEKLVNDGIFSADELNGFDGQPPENNTNNNITSNSSSNNSSYVASKKQMYLDRKKTKA